MNRKTWRLILVALLALGALGAVMILVPAEWWALFQDRAALEQLVHRLGPWGPLAIVVAEILQVIFAPIPGQIVSFVAGYLYGVALGSALCLLGLGLGTLLALWLARRLGRPLVERLANPQVLARFDRYAERRGALTFFLIFLLPFLPDDVCAFIAGLTSLRISKLLVLAILGRLPGVVVSAALGAQVQELTWLQLGLISAAGIVLGLLVIHYQEALERAMFDLLDRLIHSKE